MISCTLQQFHIWVLLELLSEYHLLLALCHHPACSKSSLIDKPVGDDSSVSPTVKNYSVIETSASGFLGPYLPWILLLYSAKVNLLCYNWQLASLVMSTLARSSDQSAERTAEDLLLHYSYFRISFFIYIINVYIFWSNSNIVPWIEHPPDSFF